MATCDCDRLDFPRTPRIPPNLSELPRQIGLFGDFRQRMVGRIGDHAALLDWRARDENDFGLLILEWWSYVADVVSFYTSQHVHELYLGTARVEDDVRRIVELIGYIPRPATASTALLAALLDGTTPINAPAGARFISASFDNEPPQDFELDVATALEPRRNEWTLSPIRSGNFERDRMLMDPNRKNVVDDDIIVFEFPTQTVTTRVVSMLRETALDGQTYLRLRVRNTGLLPATHASIDDVRLSTFRQTAPLSALSGDVVTLDGLYPQVRAQALVAIETDGDDVAHFTVSSIANGRRVLVAAGTGTPEVTTPTTELTLDRAPGGSAQRKVLHFGRLSAGRLVLPARHSLQLADLLPSTGIDGPNEPPETDVDTIALKGASDRGAHLSASVHINSDTGETILTPDASSGEFDAPLRTPVKAHANLLTVTRGKSVAEILGSGQGSIPFQTFKLSKKPLTYVADPAAPNGRRSTLRILVDNIEWTEVHSLFLSGPADRVYSVRLDSSGQAEVTFGGFGYGLPASLGVDNITARYRFGAGEPPPPPNSIRQIAAPIPGLRRVFNVRPAYGGGPGDQPADIRHLAAASAATFDRAVSAGDFAAMARDFGALNAIAVTEWVPDKVKVGVVLTAIFSGDPSPEAIAALRQHLIAKAAEATPVRIIAAVPMPGNVEINYAVHRDANPLDVRHGIRAALEHEYTGLLSPRQAVIGGPLFRSKILATIAKTTGIQRIESLLLDGSVFPQRVPLGAHEYFDPVLRLTEVPL